MAAWSSGLGLKLKNSKLKLGKMVCATIFVGDCLKVKNYFDRDLP